VHRRSFALLRGCWRGRCRVHWRGHWRARLQAQLARQKSGTLPGAARQAGQQRVSHSRKAQCKRADSAAQTGRLYNFLTRRTLPARQWMVLIQGGAWPARGQAPHAAGGAVWRGGLPLLSAAGPGTGWRRTCGACPGSLEARAGRGARQPQPGACGAPQAAVRAWRCAGPAVQGQGG